MLLKKNQLLLTCCSFHQRAARKTSIKTSEVRRPSPNRRAGSFCCRRAAEKRGACSSRCAAAGVLQQCCRRPQSADKELQLHKHYWSLFFFLQFLFCLCIRCWRSLLQQQAAAAGCTSSHVHWLFHHLPPVPQQSRRIRAAPRRGVKTAK